MIAKTLSATRILLIGAVIALGLAGCQKYGEQKRAGLLEDTVRFYNSAIRWSDFAGAASAIRPREGEAVAVDHSHLTGVRVTSNDYRINAASPDALEAEMVAVFKYQMPDSASVRTATQRATWWYDEKLERWFLDGTKMPF